MAINPVVMVCPYLPLRTPIEFGEWWLGPLGDFHGPWLSGIFEARALQFLGAFRLPVWGGGG
jgi:hypothetical protein